MPSKALAREIAAEFLEKEHSSEWEGARLFDVAVRAAESGGLIWEKTGKEAVSWAESVLLGVDLNVGDKESGEAIAVKTLLALEAAVGNEWDEACCCDALAEALRSGEMACSEEWLKRMQSPQGEPAPKKTRKNSGARTR